MDTYFKLKTIFSFYFPITILCVVVLVIIGLIIYAKLHYVLIDKKKFKLMENANYKHEVRDVASCGDKAWYHWIKRGRDGWISSSLRDEEFDKMSCKELKAWISNESGKAES